MPAASIDLDQGATSVSAARHFVTDCLLDWHAERLLDPTVLLVSEIVTNAVFHGSPPVRLRVVVEGAKRARIEVSDADPAPPAVVQTGPLAASGRGLQLVDALASEWGHQRIPDDGKVVWFEVSR